MHLLSRPKKWVISVTVFVPALVVFLLMSNLWTYSRLTHEAPVADLRFRQIGNERYLVVLRLPKGEEQRFVLNGDEWQLDARVIKWQPWANLLGLDAAYRLERIAGRYRNEKPGRHHTSSTHRLAPPTLIDVWTLARENSGWLPVFDTAYGSSVYLPMEDGLAYHVSISQTGLLARAVPQMKERSESE